MPDDDTTGDENVESPLTHAPLLEFELQLVRHARLLEFKLQLVRAPLLEFNAKAQRD
jgi:hypothetical protein